MTAEEHIWTLILRDGQALSGEDDYPDEMSKLNAKTFILYVVPGGDFDGTITLFPIEMEIPEGYGLVFKRRNWIHMEIGGDAEGQRDHKYILGIKPIGVDW